MKYVIDGTKESAGHDNSKPWYLLGIVSFGTCGKGNPGIFTRWEIVLNHLIFSTSFKLQVGELHTMDPEDHQ